MFVSSKTIGNFGEKSAEHYLIKLGYVILKRNFRCKIGEIDIIAKDKNYIAFIEVKTRYNTSFGSPYEAITKHKKMKLYKTAQIYISMNNLSNFNFRFDVVQIIANTKNDTLQIDIIKDAFQINS